MGAQELIDFDREVRTQWGEFPHDLVRMACDRSGYLREQAVVELAGLGTPRSLAVLALRAADWVPQVRSAARRACERWLTQPHGLVGLAPVAFAVRRRREGRWLADRVTSALRSAGPEMLEAALAAQDVPTRRAAYTAALDGNRLSPQRVRAAALSERDTVIRRNCAISAVWMARAAGDFELLRELATSRLAAVRTDVVHLLGRAGELGPARGALADRSAMVRATAQTVLRRAGESPAELYRSMPISAPVVAGLGETGTAADAALILPALDSPRPRCRAEAVRALRKLDVSPPPARLLELLVDLSPAVGKQVVRSLVGRSFDEQVVWNLLGSDVPHVRLAAYRLQQARGGWSRVRADLLLIGDDELGVRAAADLRQWIAHESMNAYLPARDDPETVSLIAAAEPVLGEQTTRHLRFVLDIG